MVSLRLLTTGRRKSEAGGRREGEPVAVSDEASVTQWIGRLANGDDSAAEKIWRRYYERLVKFARHKLAGTDGRASDEEDLAQSFFGSFFHAAAAGRFPKLNDRDSLWRLLLVIASRKAASSIRRDMAQKRRPSAAGEAAHRPPRAIAGDCELDRMLCTEPTPEFAALAEEQCQILLDLLGDDTLRQIALLRLEGYTVEEIAERLDRAPGTIHRKLGCIRDKWQEHDAA
jgi:RNA polymerase sigma factor (sigma-70 family)